MTADRQQTILFVDDRAKRIYQALKKYSKFIVAIAPNVPEALRLLSRFDWDIVSFDFDLDGYDYSDPNSKTCGMEIVRYLEKTKWPERKKLPTFIIHSSNSFGAALMYARMTKLFPPPRLVLLEPFTYHGSQA